MMPLLLIGLAYLGGFFLVAPLGALAGALLGLGQFVIRSEFWFFVSSFAGAIVSLILLRLWFTWLDVSFFWWSYVICMISVVLNDGARAAGGASPFSATGTTFGIATGIYYGFFADQTMPLLGA